MTRDLVDDTAEPLDLSATNKPCHLLKCPDEVLNLIVSYLHLPERLEARLVCKHIRFVIESQLSSVKSLDVTGRSVKSMLDFVKDAKGREVHCEVRDHRTFVRESLRKVGSFDRVCLLIDRYFHHLTFIRFHKITLTLEGLQKLTQSPCWRHLEHLTVRSCYLGNCDLDENILQTLSIPMRLTHFNYLTITNNEKLQKILKHLTQHLQSTQPNVINVII